MNELASPVASLEEAIDRLRVSAPQLRALGVEAVTVFGSFAEHRAERHSDVDVLVEPRPSSFRRLLDIQDRLEDIFLRDVDVVTPGTDDADLLAAIRRTGRRCAL